jgi:hypothetical protein
LGGKENGEWSINTWILFLLFAMLGHGKKIFVKIRAKVAK